MFSRRRFLQLGLTVPLLSATMGRARASSAKRPRYVVFVVLGGGFDSIFTTDPRTHREIDAGVDVPYAQSAIVEQGTRRFGPHLAPFGAGLSQLTLVNGVRTNTAAHDIGMMQLVRLKTNAVRRMPSFLDLVGRVRDGQPIGAVTLGADDIFYSSGWFGTAQFPYAGPQSAPDIFDRMLEQSPEEQRIIAGALEAQRRSIAMTAGQDGQWLLDELDANVALWKGAASWPKLAERDWGDHSGVARHFQRATWLLENDITRGVLISCGTATWDTHEKNSERQTGLNTWVMPILAHFFAELGTRKNRFASLAEQTLVVVGTEMGRMPFLNHRAGKDHLPQVPFILQGPGLRADTFGSCGRQMETRDVELTSGRSGAHRLMLDDVGVSLLRHCGVDPAPHGYLGSNLDFLFT